MESPHRSEMCSSRRCGRICRVARSAIIRRLPRAGDIRNVAWKTETFRAVFLRDCPAQGKSSFFFMMRRKTAVKYCGGCNPAFDRAAYVRRILSAAEDRIEWTTHDDDDDWENILLVHGCDTACLEKHFDLLKRGSVISVRNGDRDPEEIVKRIISGGEDEDKNKGRLCKKPE